MKNNYRCLNSNVESENLSDKSGCFDNDKISIKKRRVCLKCRKKFLSTGPYNRICEKCVLSNERIALKTFCVNPKRIGELNK